jgi:hypothetical protein
MAITAIFRQNIFSITKDTADARNKEMQQLIDKAIKGDKFSYMKVLELFEKRIKEGTPLFSHEKDIIGKMRMKMPSWASSHKEGLTASFAQEGITEQTIYYLRENFEAFYQNSNPAMTGSNNKK